jgi:hypothetical protein
MLPVAVRPQLESEGRLMVQPGNALIKAVLRLLTGRGTASVYQAMDDELLPVVGVRNAHTV